MKTSGGVCASYGAGHQVHWIQWQHALASEPVDVELAGIEGDRFVLTGADGHRFSVWTHDLARVREAFDASASGPLLYPAWGALRIGNAWFSYSADATPVACRESAGRATPAEAASP